MPYIGIHVLHPIPPASINRGEDGLPKTATIGGVLRGRLSSQSQKYALRKLLREDTSLDEALENCASRTKKFPIIVREHVATKVEEAGVTLTEEQVKRLDDLIVGTVGQDGKRPRLAGAIGSWTDRQMARAAVVLTDMVLHGDDGDLFAKGKGKKRPLKAVTKNLITDALLSNPSVDQALFGRMVASLPNANYEAAVQVSHAFTIDGIDFDLDAFTAMDDLIDSEAEEDTAGAAMLGTRAFWSGITYRHANVSTKQLTDTLNEFSSSEHEPAEVAAIIRWFATQFPLTLPLGGGNGFAHHTLPADVIYTVGSRPTSLAGAYTSPDTSSGSARLRSEAQRGVKFGAFDLVTDSLDEALAAGLGK